MEIRYNLGKPKNRHQKFGHKLSFGTIKARFLIRENADKTKLLHRLV